MKLIRLLVFSSLSLFVIASVIGIIMPSTVLVSRAVNMMASKDSVMRHISSIDQWKPWMDGMDQASVKIYSPAHADLAGTIVNITHISDTTVVSSWVTKNSSMQLSTIRVIGNPGQKITVVQWQFEQKLKWYPWERLGSMMSDKILGTMMEKNLNNLRLLVEKQ